MRLPRDDVVGLYSKTIPGTDIRKAHHEPAGRCQHQRMDSRELESLAAGGHPVIEVAFHVIKPRWLDETSIGGTPTGDVHASHAHRYLGDRSVSADFELKILHIKTIGGLTAEWSCGWRIGRAE